MTGEAVLDLGGHPGVRRGAGRAEDGAARAARRRRLAGARRVRGHRGRARRVAAAAAALAELHRLFSAPTAGAAAGPELGGNQRLTRLSEQARQLDRGPVAAVVAGGRGRGRARPAGGPHRAGRRAAGRGPVVGRGRGRARGQLRRAVRDLPGRVRCRRRAAHIAKCWASGFSAHALDYRRRFGGSSAAARPRPRGRRARAGGRAVGGRGVHARPGHRRPRCLVVEGNWGFGESVVSGHVTPDHWTVDRASGRVLTARAGAKLTWAAVSPDCRPGGARRRCPASWPGRRA